jgi:hypothetical protein
LASSRSDEQEEVRCLVARIAVASSTQGQSSGRPHWPLLQLLQCSTHCATLPQPFLLPAVLCARTPSSGLQPTSASFGRPPSASSRSGSSSVLCSTRSNTTNFPYAGTTSAALTGVSPAGLLRMQLRQSASSPMSDDVVPNGHLRFGSHMGPLDNPSSALVSGAVVPNGHLRFRSHVDPLDIQTS